MALVGDSSLPVEAYDTHTAESAVVSWFACYSAANSGGELILPPTTRPIWKDLGGMAGNLFIYFLAKETPGPSVQWCTASEAQASESPVGSWELAGSTSEPGV